MTDTEAGFLTRLYRKFILVALVNGIGIGSVAGVVFLHRLRLGSGAVTVFQKEAHGHVQIFGFVLMLILGVGYHSLPRFLGVKLERKRSALASFWLLTLASFGWLVSIFASTLDVAHIARLASSVALLGGAACFLRVMLGLARGRWATAEPYLKFLVLGTVGFLLAGATDLAVSVLHDSALSQSCGPLNESVYALALYGGVLPWVYGMSLRSAFMFLGSKDPYRSGVIGSLWLSSGGALLMGLGQGLSSVRVEAAGVAGVASGALVFIASARIFEPPKFKVELGAFPFAAHIRAAYSFLALFAALGGLWVWISLRHGVADRTLFQDGMRHAFATGFLFLMITGMMARVIPVFAGKVLRLPRVVAIGSVLLVTGALLRQAEVLAALVGSSRLFRLSGHSGDLSLAGLVVCIVPVVLSMALPAPAADRERLAALRQRVSST